MGAGLYSLLGLASSHAGTHVPLAFLIGAIAASFSVYSYAKLGSAFPSSGGAASPTSLLLHYTQRVLFNTPTPYLVEIYHPFY